VKLGAHFLPEDFQVFVESVQAAERAGYDRAWLVDGQMLWQDLYVYMTHALAATERIEVGSGVTNPLTRHPAVTASAHATLADLHPGRVVLGVGRGDNAVRTLGLKPVPTAELAETVPRLRAWMAGEEAAGTRIRWADESVPIMLCATGPKNLRVAGALADIVMIYVGVHPASVRWAIEHVRPASSAPAACANHIASALKWNPRHGMPDEMTRLVAARDRYDYYAGHLDSAAEHTSYLTGELVDDFVIAGPVERCLERIGELGGLGVDEVSAAYLNGRFEQMELVGQAIIPALREVKA